MFASHSSRRCIAIGAVLMMGSSGAWALSTDELSAINNLAAQQTATIEKHRAAALAHILNAMPALSDKQASELANALVANPALLSTLQSLDDEGSAKLFGHFATMLQKGGALTTEHFDSLLSQIKDASTLQALGIGDINALSSPILERVISPASISTTTVPAQIITGQANFDEAYYLAQNPDVAAAVKVGAFASGWAHYDSYGRAEGRPFRSLSTPSAAPTSTTTGTAPAPATASQTAQPSSTPSYDDLVKELKAVLADVEIEIADGAAGTAGSITQQIAQNDPMVKQILTGKGKPEEVVVWIKTLINLIEQHKDNPLNSPAVNQAALKPTVEQANSLLGLLTPAGKSQTQQTGTANTQAINDALRRSMQTSTPGTTSAPAPAPAKICYPVEGKMMCH